jgi:hypothetical protein
MALYKANNVGVGRLMLSNRIRHHVTNEAERMADHLRTTAPRGATGNYASRFTVQSGLDDLEQDRWAAYIVNDSRQATALEVGSYNIKNPPMPMTRALNEALGLGD